MGMILPRVATHEELAHIELLIHGVYQYISPRPSRFVLTVFPNEAHHRLTAWEAIQAAQHLEDENRQLRERLARLEGAK